MSKHRVTLNDTERRAPSTLATGRLNQGVLRGVWPLGVRPRGQSGVPLLRVRLQPFRRGRGSTGPLGQVPPPGIRACSPKGWGTGTRSVPQPFVFVLGPSTPVAECPASPNVSSADHGSVLTMPSLPENERAFLESTTMLLEAQDAVTLFI